MTHTVFDDDLFIVLSETKTSSLHMLFGQVLPDKLGQILAEMSRGRHHTATHASRAHLLEPLSIAMMQHRPAAQQSEIAETQALPLVTAQTLRRGLS